MATEVVKNVLNKDEVSLVMVALGGQKQSYVRAKTKAVSTNDRELIDYYDRKMVTIDQLMAKISNKELF